MRSTWQILRANGFALLLDMRNFTARHAMRLFSLRSCLLKIIPKVRVFFIWRFGAKKGFFFFYTNVFGEQLHIYCAMGKVEIYVILF